MCCRGAPLFLPLNAYNKDDAPAASTKTTAKMMRRTLKTPCCSLSAAFYNSKQYPQRYSGVNASIYSE